MKKIALSIVGGLALLASGVANAGTLQDVKNRGELKCIVSTGTGILSYIDNSGRWQGIDAEYCRALAAAVFGDAEKVKFVPVTGKTRFTSLQSGEGDVLSRGTTWTLSRDTDLGFNFVGVIWYDGQGFLMNKKLGVNSAKQLNGASVCIKQGTTSELNVAEYFKMHNIKYRPIAVEKDTEALKLLASGGCDVFTSDTTALATVRKGMKNPSNWELLPEIISKEPLGPLVRHGDDQWFDVASWTLRTLIAADEMGITSKNVDSFKNSKNKEILRILGHEGQLGEFLGIPKDFGYQVIKQVGNHREIYDRTFAKIGLKRSINSSWREGGLLYSPPFR